MEMYSIHKKGKPVVAERFIRTLKNKTHKCMKKCFLARRCVPNWSQEVFGTKKDKCIVLRTHFISNLKVK